MICGDFQSLRDEIDMQNMACPVKYQRLGDFPSYFTGKLKAPFLTIFIGGNHEASNYLQQLYFGGWAAPNIYFMGNSGVIRVKKGGFSFRLAGVSGIFNQKDFFTRKNMEILPLNGFSKRSCYHMKEKELLKIHLVFLSFLS